MPVTRQCLTCEATFKVPPWKIRAGWGKYCSHKCCPPPSPKTQFKKGQLAPNWNGFKKGIPSLMKGKKLGFIPKMAFKKGNIPWCAGTKGVLKAWNKGRKETRKDVLENFRISHLGKKLPIEQREKISQSQIGEKHWNWQGGKSKLNKYRRECFEYRLWRESVFKRDGYECIWCHKKGKLNADHIKPYSLFPELRFAIDNGRTLCVECHRKTDTYGLRAMYKDKKHEFGVVKAL